MATAARNLRIKIFADGADLETLAGLRDDGLISGFTTNPTLMRRAGVSDYEGFARSLLEIADALPASFEVLSDDFEEMRREARWIASWGENVYVKIPVTNTRGESSEELVRELAAGGVKVNVTAVMTARQIGDAVTWLDGGAPSFVSVFAGRIADTGRDPIPIVRHASELVRPHAQIELIWASAREVLNVVHAELSGCDVITLTNDLIRKLAYLGRDLEEFSRDTVRTFYRDAADAGLNLTAGDVIPRALSDARLSRSR